MTYKFDFSEGPTGRTKQTEDYPFPTDPPPSVPTIQNWANLPKNPADGDLQRYEPTAGSSSMVVQYNSASSAWIAGGTNDNWVDLPIVKSSSLNTDLFPKQVQSSSISTNVNGSAFEVTTSGSGISSSQEWRVQSDFLLPRTGGVTRIKITLSEQTSENTGLTRANSGPVQQDWNSDRYGAFGMFRSSGSNVDVRFMRFDSGSFSEKNSTVSNDGDSNRFHVMFSVRGANALVASHEYWQNGSFWDAYETVGGFSNYSAGEIISNLTRFFVWVEATDEYDGEHTFKLENLKIKI